MEKLKFTPHRCGNEEIIKERVNEIVDWITMDASKWKATPDNKEGLSREEIEAQVRKWQASPDDELSLMSGFLRADNTILLKKNKELREKNSQAEKALTDASYKNMKLISENNTLGIIVKDLKSTRHLYRETSKEVCLKCSDWGAGDKECDLYFSPFRQCEKIAHCTDVNAYLKLKGRILRNEKTIDALRVAAFGDKKEIKGLHELVEKLKRANEVLSCVKP